MFMNSIPFFIDNSPPKRIDPDLVNNTILHREIDDTTAAIFAGSDDRHIYAIDARNGELLWKVETKQDTGERITKADFIRFCK